MSPGEPCPCLVHAAEHSLGQPAVRTRKTA
jgi:hypothetical protein